MGLDGVEIVLEIEDRFAIRVSDDEAADVRTVDHLVDLVIRRLREGDDPPVISDAPLRPMVFAQVRGILAEQLGITPGRVTPGARRREDLGSD